MATMILAAVMLLFATPAYAYIDPGTGSLIIQMLLAALVGSVFYLRTIIRRIKSFFGSAPERALDPPPDDHDRAEP
jgi:hypothetical protein